MPISVKKLTENLFFSRQSRNNKLEQNMGKACHYQQNRRKNTQIEMRIRTSQTLTDKCLFAKTVPREFYH
jgi:hypothetical protein